MAKNLNVSLAFTANTNEAIAAIKRLQKELNGLATGSVLKDSGISQITPEIQKAMVAAGELQAKLEAATNLKTGKLDLGQFSDSLKKGGVSLQQYANQLNALGPAGRQAFTNLAQSIIQAEAPLIRCSQRVKELGTTLANTARWQLSSSILHGFMGAVSSAYGYAQDLNKSLNDIRIVTGASVAEMDQFAAKANKAARALSTTTNEYAKASLIYFQQGDTQAQAMDKAAITTKMANVTGQSAEVVSNQLTAIWNNFNKEGDVAYEHYADVLTKLGAATASSTDEIAGGLEKFAGIADQIGLSYEYAASALATITATSRESEEVVGTALKTIFARIQGLNLGETLDDGTTLNKYSEALQKVGISIFEQNGEMKQMDSILKEMADKWETLNSDQQTALAQTVAGVRQYTQLSTLMNNWDFMEENLKTAYSADGELDAQAEIYAESWRAARDEVRAAAEELYTKLLNDDFFIGFLNGIEKVIDGVSNLVDAFGGLGGVLTTIGAYVTRIFQKEMAQGLRTAAQNIKGFINPKGVQAEQDAKKAEAIQALRNMKSFSGGQEGKAENIALSHEASMQERLYQVAKNISEEEAKQLQIQMDSVRAMDKRAIAAAKNLDVAEKELKSLQDQNRLRAKMDAQVEARDRGRTKAGKALLEQAHKGVGQNTTSFGESERQVVLAAEARAQQAVRSRHNFTADVSLDGYEDEIALELTRQLKSALADLDLKDGVDKKSVQGQLDKAIREAVVEATSGADVKGIGENVNKYQAQVQKAGNLNAQGIALSKLGAGGLTTQGADAKGLESIYTQLKTRIEAAQQAASELKAEVKDSGNSSREIAQLNGVFEGLQAELEEAKGDAEALQRILDKLADESGAGELISRVSQNIGGEGGYIAQEANDGINQPSFDMSGQFESATNVGLKNIQSHNANVDVKNSQQNLNDSFDKAGQGIKDWADGIADATNIIFDLGSAITSVQGLLDVFNNPDASGWDKLVAVFSALTGILPLVNTLFTVFGNTAAGAGLKATVALGPITVPILAIVAAIGVLIGAFVLLGHAIQQASPEAKLEAAKKKSEELTGALDSAKSAAEELKAAFDGYDSAVKALEECTKGTQEWRDALRNVNSEVLELMDSYPDLATMTNDKDEKAITRDPFTGQLQVADWAREDLTSRANQAIENTQIASIISKADVREAEIAVERSNLSKSLSSKTMGINASATIYGEQVDMGYAMRQYISQNAEQLSRMSQEEQAKFLQEYVDSQNISTDVNSWVNAISDLSSQFTALGNSVEANTAAIQLENETMAETILADEEKVQNSDYASEITKIVSQDLDKNIDAEMDLLADWGKKGISKATGVNKEARDVFAEYAEAAGITNYDLIDTTGTDKNRNFVYTDANKNEVTVSLEAMKAVVAAANASEKLATNADQLVNVMSDRESSEIAAITAAATKDANQLTVGQVKDEDATATAEAIAKTLEKTDLEALGFEGELDDMRAAFVEAYKQTAAQGSELLNNTISKYDGVIKNSLTDFNYSGKLQEMTIGEVDALGQQMENIFNVGGEKALNSFNNIFSSLDPTQTDDFAEALNGINWETTDLESLSAQLQAAGINVSAFEGSLAQLIEAIQADSIGIDAATAKYADLHSVINGLSTGDTISEEQFNKFEQYGIDAEKYFMLMADGTYKLTGDAQKLYDLVNGETIEEFKKNIIDLENQKNDIQNVKNQITDLEGKANQDSYDKFASTAGTYDSLTETYLLDEAGQAKANSQIDYLEALGGIDPEQIAKWRQEVAAGTIDAEALSKAVKTATENAGGLDKAVEQLAKEHGKLTEKQKKNLEAILSQSSSYKSLQKAVKSNNADMITTGKALVSLGSQYVSCQDEINAFNKALDSEDPKKIEEAYKALDEAVKKADFEKFTEDTLDFLETLKDDEAWTSNIEKVNQLREAYQYLLETDFSNFSEEFLTSAKNINLMTEALKGSDEAWDQLKINAAQDMFDFAGISGSLRTELDAVTAMIAGYDFGDIEIGTDLNDTPFWEALSQMEIGSTDAAQAITDGLSSMGVDAELEKHEVTIPPGKSYETRNGYHEYVDNEGVLHQIPINSQVTETDQGQTYTWYTLKGAKYNGKGVTPPEPPAKDRNPSGGGGGSQPKKATPTKKSDVVQRYKEVEDKLDDIREEADRTRSSLDRLYGAEHEAAIQRLLELEQQEIDLLKEKEQEAQNYLREDLKELKKVSAEVDVEFKFDDNNNIENYEEEMTELYEELAEIERKAGSEWDENEQKEIDALNEKIKKLEEAMAAYEETRELLEDINAELDAFKGKPALPLITSDNLDIYWEIDDALDDIDEKITDLERKAESLSGEEKLKVLEEINRLEQDRVAILQQQAEINRKDIEEKRAALDELARLNGLQFEYDENNNITNYQEQLGILQAQLDELYAKQTADGFLSPADEDAVNAITAKMKELADYAEDYRGAVEESEDILNEIEDTLSGVAADPFVRSDFVDIFKETNDQLDDIQDKISKLERKADKLTGEERIKVLQEIAELEREHLKILDQQAEIAKEDMEYRKGIMEEIAEKYELIFEYDDNGNITNYIEQLDILISKYKEAYDEALSEDGLISKTEQEILDAIEQDIDELENYIEAYCEAVEKMEDIENERSEISESGYVDMEQLDEIGDELHDINRDLDDLQEALDDSAAAADRLYGDARIKQMNKTAQLLDKEIRMLEEKKKLQNEIIANERQELSQMSGGVAQFDEKGNLTNYQTLIDLKKVEIQERKAELESDGDFTEAEAEEIQEMINELNKLVDQIDEYEQALENVEDIQNEIDDAFYEWQDLNAEALEYKLELTLDVNQRELDKIERQLKRIGDNFYSRAEALALMVGTSGSSQINVYIDQLQDLEAQYNSVKAAYDAGQISHEAYVSQTKELQNEINSTTDAIVNLQAQMDSYYKDTLAAARQELAFYTAQMEHLTSILNHFKGILTALGKSQDHQMMDTVLRGQVKALENEVKVQKQAISAWQGEADKIYAKYQQELAAGNEENANMYYQAYQEALSAANDAENKYYAKSQQWAQALRSLMENTLSGLAQDLENALTGGTSMEELTNSLKRASSLQEEYLTTTNKIYETTKLMRNAQNEIDKTTNSVAKKRLASFIVETNQLQNKNKLSKYELSIQQAKYDLLMAEIALEEARFAKSTVRLKRDAEGNFGYVYTANAEAINSAEQKFEDAQNKLYNIGLEGANKYTEKYQQTLAEMYNTLTALQNKYLQGGFESEAEYNAAVTAAKEYYYDKLSQYSELYSVALTTDSRVVADAWSTDFADMTQKTEQWMSSVTSYLGEVRNAFAEWERESDRIANETVGSNLQSLQQNVNDIVTESNNMVNTIIGSGGVLDSIIKECVEVGKLADQYAILNGTLDQTITKYDTLYEKMNQDIEDSTQAEMDKIEDLTEEDLHVHTYSKSVTSPTCTERGYTTYTCGCGDSYDAEFVPALGHDFTEQVIAEATETSNTKVRKTCQRCGYYEDYEINGSKLEPPKDPPEKKPEEKPKDEPKDPPEEKPKEKPKDPPKEEPKDPPKEEPKEEPKTGYSDTTKRGVALAIWNGGHGWGNDPDRSKRLKERKFDAKEIQKLLNNTDPSGGWEKRYPGVGSDLSKYSYKNVEKLYGKFDTGGYTGAWGPEGKWAMLHEKEIILNKDDTKNFLASLELLDSILSTIDLHTMNSQFNGMFSSPYISNLGKEMLEQQVSIEANFPNVTDKQEIEDAFKNLVNLASQYANRK